MSSTRPESAHISQPPPVAGPDAPKPPASVSFEDYVAAVRPLMSLAGVELESVFAESFKVTEDRIEFTTCAPVSGVEPVVVGDDPEWAEWGWPVVVKVDRP